MKFTKYKGGNTIGELDSSVKLIESNYPTQSPLTVVNELPEMKNNITTRVIDTVRSTSKKFETSPNHYWTNDDNLYNVGLNSLKPCNIYGIQFTDPPHMYSCISVKLCYYISDRLIRIQNEINVDIRTPDYVADEPYRFIHYGNFFERRMNIFNMLVSPSILNLIEFKNIEWLNRHPLVVTHPFSISGPMRRNVPGQLITPRVSSLSTIKYDNDVKFQMCIKDEYVYWAVETILIHYRLLVNAGLLQFKYTFSLSEKNMYSCAEIFPDVLPTQPIHTYTEKGIKFKTELLLSPNIVFYTRVQDNYTELATILCRLFPDNLNERIDGKLTQIVISTGISRFNMRLNNNVSFSIDGNNENKFEHPIDIIPDEYNLIINEVNQNPSRCSLLESYSKLITGSTLLTDCKVNKILSHNSTCYPYPSFKYIYAKYGLLDYYIKLPPDLDSKIILGKIPVKPSDIDKYLVEPISQAITLYKPMEKIKLNKPPIISSIPSRRLIGLLLHPQSYYGKGTKKRYKRRTRRNLKKN
jgi:hypothetical protein